MRVKALQVVALFLVGCSAVRAQMEQFVEVQKDVKLQVLDWGGNGRALVLLGGLGSDAHVFDHLAPQFTKTNHVYAVTRRGFGASSKPAATLANYGADRLGDDVIAVIDGLKLERPVLAGHSIAGEELSSVGSRHPEKVAGLVYLDAADSYAAYDPPAGDWLLDMIAVRKEIDATEAGAAATPEFLETMRRDVASLEKSLKQVEEQVALMPGAPPPPPPIAQAIRFGEKKYTRVDVPALAIVACPHDFGFVGDAKGAAALKAQDLGYCTARIAAVKKAMPKVKVVKVVTLPNADHFVFRTNEAQVVSAMKTFLSELN